MPVSRAGIFSRTLLGRAAATLALTIVAPLLLDFSPTFALSESSPPPAATNEPAPITLRVEPPTLAGPTLTTPTARPGEVRAMWIVRDTLTSPARIKNAVALAKKHGFNTLFVQVRGRGDAYYESRWEPRAEQLADQPRDFDPLALVIDEGHRTGLQVHAWLNTFFVWHQQRRPYSALHVVNRHPEWLVADKQGRVRLTEGKDREGAFLDPAHPGVREHTKNVFLDVATRYAVDGIHFDYVRFPCEDYSFSDYSLQAFRAYLLPRLTPAQAAYLDSRRAQNRLAWYQANKGEWRAWRQSLVTETVRSVYEEAHRLRPEIIVSAAVFPNYEVALLDKGQAWRDWLRAGVLDAVCPMSYNKSTPFVAAQIRAAVAHAHGRPVIGGVGSWQMSADSAIAKARAYRSLGASGVNFFSYNGMTREGASEAYLAKISRSLFGERVALPDWRRPIETANGPDQPGRG
jgi:uncharacterized lipoprotein YddW (UPF0748 family)